MIHLTLQQISSYIDEELPEASMELVRRHLSTCAECTERFARMEAQEEIIGRVMANDPGEEFFAGFSEALFSDRKRDARRSAKRRPASAPSAGASTAARAAGAPAAAASAATGAPAAAASAVAETTPRAGRGGAWIAVSLLVLAASVALVVAVRHSPLVSSGPARVVTTVGESGAAAPPARPVPPRADADPFAALERAARASSNAERDGTAGAYDAASEAWERALPALHGDAAEEAAGRQELMEARYRAWTLDPTAARRAGAIEAVRDYLVIAPSDGQRDSAWSWLARLKR